MRQRIIIPKRITNTVFSLPCVGGVNKSGMTDEHPVYHLLTYMMADDDQPLFAVPGDTLIEEDGGKWRVEKAPENEAEMSEREKTTKPTMEYPELP